MGKITSACKQEQIQSFDIQGDRVKKGEGAVVTDNLDTDVVRCTVLEVQNMCHR